MDFFSNVWLAILKVIDGAHERWRIFKQRFGKWFFRRGPGKIYSKFRDSLDTRIEKLDLKTRSGSTKAKYFFQVRFLDSVAEVRDRLGLKVKRTSDNVKRSPWVGRFYDGVDFVILSALSVGMFFGRIFSLVVLAVSFAWGGLEERVANSKYFSWLAVFFRLTREGCALTAEFLESWYRSRSYIRLVLGVPAILFAAPLIYCLIRIPLRSDIGLANQYRQAAAKAWEDENFDAAKLYYRKISQLGVLQEAAIYQAALMADQQGDAQAAYDQMLGLVQTQDSPSAKLWLAHKLMSSDEQIKTGFDSKEERLAQAEIYIEQLLAFNPESPAALYAKGLLEFHRGNHEGAIAILRTIADEFPSALTTIASIERQRGNLAAARKIINETNQSYAARKDYLNWRDRIHWARTQMFAGEWNGMIDTIDRALDGYADNKDFQDAVADLYVNAFDRLRLANQRIDIQFRLMEHAMKMQSGRTEFLDRLALLTESEKYRDAAIKLLQENYPKDVFPESVLLILARSAYLKGDYAEARKHLEACVTIAPKNPITLNNLAWLMANSEPADLQKALDYATRAIQLDPSNPEYRETRGQIQVRLKRWQDAVEDLRVALNAQPDNVSIHTSLSVAYKNLGDSELADVHARQADRVH